MIEKTRELQWNQHLLNQSLKLICDDVICEMKLVSLTLMALSEEREFLSLVVVGGGAPPTTPPPPAPELPDLHNVHINAYWLIDCRHVGDSWSDGWVGKYPILFVPDLKSPKKPFGHRSTNTLHKQRLPCLFGFWSLIVHWVLKYIGICCVLMILYIEFWSTSVGICCVLMILYKESWST